MLTRGWEGGGAAMTREYFKVMGVSCQEDKLIMNSKRGAVEGNLNVNNVNNVNNR